MLRLVLLAMLVGVLAGARVGRAGTGAPGPEMGPRGQDNWARLLLVGDSIVAGVPGETSESGLPARVQAMLQHWVVWPYARGLWTASLDWYGPAHFGGPARPNVEAVRDLLVPGDAVVLLLGTNDFALSRPLDVFRLEYARMIDRLANAETLTRGPGPTVRVCVTPIWRRDSLIPNRAGLVLADYARAIREVCGGRRLPLVDGLRLLDPRPELFRQDGIHPNDAGTQVLGRRLGAELDKILENERAHPQPGRRDARHPAPSFKGQPPSPGATARPPSGPAVEARPPE